MKSGEQHYPIFEGNQLLTARHLNDLRTFLEKESNFTRKHLVGSGIVCGLESVVTSGNIRITEGIGITSAGYAFHLDQTDCEFIRPYTDHPLADMSEGEVDGQSENNNYQPFEDDDKNQIELWELLTDSERDLYDEPDIIPINISSREFDLPVGDSVVRGNYSDYLLILYIEIEDKDLSDCFGDDCDEKGVRRSFRIRKLIVHDDHLSKIVPPEEAETYPRISIHRLKNLESEAHPFANLVSFEGTNGLERRYEDAIEESVSSLAEGLDKAERLFGLLDSCRNEDGNSGLPVRNESELRELLSNAFDDHPYSVQYRHSFLKDLADALNEFFDLAEDLRITCCEDSGNFSRHLSTGRIGAGNPKSRTAARHYFVPSAAQSASASDVKKAEMLYHRIAGMLRSVNLDPLSTGEIRITPGGGPFQPIHRRPIPYYYQSTRLDDLSFYWDATSAAKKRKKAVRSYHYKGKSETDAVSRPLGYGLGTSPFFRIEGHVGKKFEEAQEVLQEKRNRHNLPIKIVGVKIAESFDQGSLNTECKFDDLQDLYRLHRLELLCRFDDDLEFFKGLKIDRKQVSGIKAEERFREAERQPEQPDIQGTVTFESRSRKTDVKAGEAARELTYRQKEMMKKEAAGKGSSSTYTGDALMTGFVQKHDSGKGEENTLGFMMADVQNQYGLINQNTMIHQRPDLMELYADFVVLVLNPFIKLVNNIEAFAETLVEKINDVDRAALEKAHTSLINTAKEYRETLKDQKSDLGGQRELIMHRLDTIIRRCSLVKITELLTIYEERIQEFKNQNLLSVYAKTHTGLEHRGGVPEGGTFVVLYMDKNESQTKEMIMKDLIERLKEEGLDQFIDLIRKADDVKSAITMIEKQLSSMTKMLGLKSAKHMDKDYMDSLHEVSKEISRALKRAAKEEKRGRAHEPDHVVVGDFMLPYIYRCGCPELNTMIVSQIVFTLPRERFCKSDTEKYSFTTSPAGGVVHSEHGGVSAEGNTYFFEPSKVESDDEQIAITYAINNQVIRFYTRVLNPVADFEYELNPQDDGSIEVIFINKSTGADSYEWDLGEGITSENESPRHIYPAGHRSVVAELTARRFDCEDSIRKVVEFPEEEMVEFRLQPSKQFGENIYCENDKQAYAFITVPKGDEIEGDELSGVISQQDTWFFVPEGYTPDGYTFSYKGETIDVKILQAPKDDFIINVKPSERAGGYTVEFIYQGEEEDLIWWIDGNSTQNRYTGNNPTVFFEMRELRPIAVRLIVRSENGCPHIIEREIELGESNRDTDLYDLVSRNFDRFADRTFDRRIFDGNNTIVAETNQLMEKIRKAVETEEGMKKLREGEMNDEIAAEYKVVLDNSAKVLDKVANEGSEEELAYVTRLYNKQTEILIKFLGEQESDINKTSEAGKLLTRVGKQYEKLKDEGVNLDPDRDLSKTLESFKVRTGNQPKLSESLNLIEIHLRR